MRRTASFRVFAPLILTIGALVVACSSDTEISVSQVPDAGTTTHNDGGTPTPTPTATTTASGTTTTTPPPPPPPQGPYAVGGTVVGLSGSGLLLQNNGGDQLVVTSDGAFTFPTKVADGARWSVEVAHQPAQPSQRCAVSTNPTGNVASANVTSIAVVCTTAKLAVGGTVAGLPGGSTVHLRNSGGDDLVVNKNGDFAFDTSVASNVAYAVTVVPVANGPTCTVAGGTGIVGAGDVTSVLVTCGTNAFAVGGQIDGLTGTVVLQNNNGNDLTLSQNGSFAFSQPATNGAPFNVTVGTQPTSPAQMCTVTGGTGNVPGANVTTIHVSCSTAKITVRATVNGLLSWGNGLGLRLNNGADVAVNADGTVTFPTQLDDGSTYQVIVSAQPNTPPQACTVSPATAQIVNGTSPTITVTCAIPPVGAFAATTGWTGTPCYDGTLEPPQIAGTTSFAYGCSETNGVQRAAISGATASWIPINTSTPQSITDLNGLSIAVITANPANNGTILYGARGAASTPNLFSTGTNGPAVGADPTACPTPGTLCPTWNRTPSPQTFCQGVLDGTTCTTQPRLDITGTRVQASLGNLIVAYDPLLPGAVAFNTAPGGGPPPPPYVRRLIGATGLPRTIANAGSSTPHDYVAVYGTTPGGSGTGGVFVSSDGGSSWTETSTVAHGFADSDRTLAWTVATDQSAGAFNTAFANIVYAGLRGGGQLYKSTNNGSIWTKASSGLPAGAEVLTIAVAKAAAAPSNTIYAGTSVGLFVSTNAGASWSYAGFGTRRIRSIGLNPNTGALVLVGVEDATGMYIAQ